MFSRLKPRLTYANVVVTLALILAMTGFAAAAIPDAGGAVHGCYQKRTGVLRVIGAGKRCSKGEKPISWNQQGPRGRDGNNGTNGTNGSNGAPGAPGTNGINGTNGTTAVVTESSPSSDGGVNPSTTGQTPNGWHIVVHSSVATTGNIEVICASP